MLANPSDFAIVLYSNYEKDIGFFEVAFSVSFFHAAFPHFLWECSAGRKFGSLDQFFSGPGVL